MWLFLINPLKLCSYGSWSLQGYVCKSSCCQCHIYTLAWILKCFIRPSTLSAQTSVHWLMTLSQPLSHSAAVPEWLMQPLSHSARVAGAATQTLSHSARVAGAATQPLSQSGWRSHSVTLPHWLEQPLSHSATLPEWLEQPLSQSGWSSHSATQSLCQSGWVAEWLMWKFPPLRVQSNRVWNQSKTSLNRVWTSLNCVWTTRGPPNQYHSEPCLN